MDIQDKTDQTSVEVGEVAVDDVLVSEKRIIRKLDWHILPPITILYLMSFLDRSNLGNAVLFGLKADLGLVGNQFNTALAIFYACYVIVEPPSNVILKRSRTSIYLTVIMALTAVMCISMGFTKNFGTLVAVRALLGLAEGGFYPGIMFMISQWYPRREAAYRGCLLYSAASASGAFGGLLARALELMDGLGGLEGWRWIFIIEGIITFLLAITMFFFIPDSPETAKFLSPEERRFVNSRLVDDSQHMSTEYKWSYIRDALTSPLVYLMMFTEFGSLIATNAFTTFAPTIVSSMGFAAGKAQLLTVPPYVLGCLSTFLFGYFSDKKMIRYPFIMLGSSIALAGFLILRFTDNIPAQYVACCLVCIGALPLIPLEITWNGNNQGGSLKRALAIAMQIGTANTSGIVSSYAYIATDAPRYKTGHAICAGFMGITLVFGTLAAAYITYHNKRRDRLYGPAAELLERLSECDIDEEKERGDRARWWRYTL